MSPAADAVEGTDRRSARSAARAIQPDLVAGLHGYPRGVTTNWNAATYDRIADPQARWGAAVLDRLPLVGDERVMDVGCGSGRVTAALAERLPRGSVVAVDAVLSTAAFHWVLDHDALF